MRPITIAIGRHAALRQNWLRRKHGDLVPTRNAHDRQFDSMLHTRIWRGAKRPMVSDNRRIGACSQIGWRKVAFFFKHP